jgi:hypothetical protein
MRFNNGTSAGVDLYIPFTNNGFVDLTELTILSAIIHL